MDGILQKRVRDTSTDEKFVGYSSLKANEEFERRDSKKKGRIRI